MSAKMSGAITVGASYAAQSAPDFDVSAEFVPDFFDFRATAGSFFYSFDGVNDHGIVNNTDLVPIKVESHCRKVWVKQNGGAATARVSAWTRA